MSWHGTCTSLLAASWHICLPPPCVATCRLVTQPSHRVWLVAMKGCAVRLAWRPLCGVTLSAAAVAPSEAAGWPGLRSKVCSGGCAPGHERSPVCGACGGAHAPSLEGRQPLFVIEGRRHYLISQPVRHNRLWSESATQDRRPEPSGCRACSCACARTARPRAGAARRLQGAHLPPWGPPEPPAAAAA